MKVLNIQEHRDGTATMTYSLTTQEREIFHDVARREKRKFDDAFINRKILGVLRKATRAKS